MYCRGLLKDNADEIGKGREGVLIEPHRTYAMENNFHNSHSI